MVNVRKVLVSVTLFLAATASVLFVTIPRVGSETSQPHTSRTEQKESKPTKQLSEAKEQSAQVDSQVAQATPVQQVAMHNETPVSQPAQPITKPNSVTFAGVDSEIVDVGLTPDGAIDVPAIRVGRWNGSAVPGGVGAVFLDGHTPGIFSNLSQLQVGSVVTIVYNQQTFTYRVVATETVPLAAVDMQKALSVQAGTANGLTMMTCAGTYIPEQQTYDKRLIVYAAQV